MSELDNIPNEKKYSIEKSTITDIPAEFELPTGQDRLVIGAQSRMESEKPDSGIEVISLATYPISTEGIINFRGTFIDSEKGAIAAILIDPTEAINTDLRTGYKALRLGEVVSPSKLAKRFGKEAGFSIGLDKDGVVIIENSDTSRTIDVLSITPNEKVLTPQESEELREEAAEDMGEVATELATEVNTSKIYSHELRAMRQAAEDSKRATGVESSATNTYDASLEPNIADIEAEKNVDVYAYLRHALPPVIRGNTEASGKYYDKFVTDENRQVSLDFLTEVVKADAHIAGIIYEAGFQPTDMATVDAIRENPDIRYKIAKWLTQKLDTLVDQDPEGFGFRVAVNSPNNLKVDPQTGKRMKSRMYAVDMALKMLGGEFSERTQDDDFARDKNDRVAIGQHRHAARVITMSRHT